jgi:hypothetical protein
MTNTDYTDDDVLPSCGLVSIIEALRQEAAAAGKQKRFGRLCERYLAELTDFREEMWAVMDRKRRRKKPRRKKPTAQVVEFWRPDPPQT